MKNQTLKDMVDRMERQSINSQEVHDYYLSDPYKERISRNREQIDNVLNQMNEGRLTPGEAKYMITMYSDDNKRLLKLINENAKGIIK